MSLRSIKSIFAISAVLFLLMACSSYVRPKKVERIITKEKWKITKFMFDGEDIASSFAEKTFGFGESGNILVLPANGESGSWTVGLNSKPTLLYIQGFTTEPYFFLNDDWTVVEASKTNIKLESEVGSVTNKVELLRVDP